MAITHLPGIPTAFVALSVALALHVWKTARAQSLKLPPGPRPLPLVGNILDMPCKHLGREYAELSSKYGDLVYLEVLGQPMVLLGSYETAQELLNKRAPMYSHRPRSIMCELIGYSPGLTVMQQYGAEWRYHRRAYQQTYRAEAVASHHQSQVDGTRRFLRSLLLSPAQFFEELEFLFAGATMQTVYGIKLTKPNDEYHNMAKRIMQTQSEVNIPGKYLVDVFPLMRFLPSWVPGVQFKAVAANARKEFSSTVNTLFKAGESANRDAPSESMLANLLRSDDDPSDEDLDLMKNVLISAYVGAVDTTHITSQVLFMAMAMYPDVQKKAQAELDAVVGVDRLPDFSDRPALPYITALVKEVFRWHIIGPLGMPRVTSEDDEYNGYLIPKGAIVIHNAWAMARDPSKYPDPDAFRPERFLDANGQVNFDVGDPADIAFGFGRRRCPGQLFADAALFILCSSVLHAFDIAPAVGEDGMPVKLSVADKMETDQMIAHIAECEYAIKPRSSRLENLILRTQIEPSQTT